MQACPHVNVLCTTQCSLYPLDEYSVAMLAAIYHCLLLQSVCLLLSTTDEYTYSSVVCLVCR